ncbi:MAG TPA: ABC transporter substrate-binding protein, partial [Thermoanaerobaculia bacterium]
MTRRLVLLYLFVSLSLCLSAHAQRRRASSASDTIVIGGLFSLTGDGATLGNASKAALELAVCDMNAEFEALRVPWNVQLVLADTKLTPSGAVDGIHALQVAGATIVIGPQSSAEAGAIVDYANANSIIVISQGSTASSLAIADDYLFRLAPNDKLEGAAIASLMHSDGIDVLVPIWRDDAGNGGLKTNTSAFFTGTVAPGVSYAPTTTDFTATVTSLGNAVRAAKSANPGKKVAVFIASFEEGASILDRARLDPDLAVNWYSGDGLTQSQALLASAPIAAFAATTKFTAPSVALSETTRNRWEPLSAEIQSIVGFAPDAFSLSVYDGAWAAVLSAIEAQR